MDGKVHLDLEVSFYKLEVFQGLGPRRAQANVLGLPFPKGGINGAKCPDEGLNIIWDSGPARDAGPNVTDVLDPTVGDFFIEGGQHGWAKKDMQRNVTDFSEGARSF